MKIKYKLLLIVGFSALAIALFNILLYLSFQSFNSSIVYFVAGLVISLILLAVIILELIDALGKKTEAIAKGNPDYKLGVQIKGGVTQLPKSFDDATEKLKASYFEDLEKKLQEKIGEKVSKNPSRKYCNPKTTGRRPVTRKV